MAQSELEGSVLNVSITAAPRNCSVSNRDRGINWQKYLTSVNLKHGGGEIRVRTQFKAACLNEDSKSAVRDSLVRLAFCEDENQLHLGSFVCFGKCSQ